MSIDAMDALRTRMNAMDAKKNAKNAMDAKNNAKNAIDAKKNANERYRRPACTRRTMAFIRVHARSCAFTSTLNSTSQLRRVGAGATGPPEF